MAAGAGVTFSLFVDAIPLLPGVRDLVRDGLVPAGCYRNRDHYLPKVRPHSLADEFILPLYDPQTSGGLLMAFPPADAAAFLSDAGQSGCFAVEIGEVIPRGDHLVELA
jgi:selenide,water dikinase